MKVLVGRFGAECNEHINHTVPIEEFHVTFGEECIQEMRIKDIFEEKGITLIPSISATTNPTGMIQKEAFDFIANKILDTIRTHRAEIDGIYLQLHGASGIVGLPEISGEHYLLREIRKIVGEFMPIAITLDPHGNITNELCSYVNLVRCYRESPHFDTWETRFQVARQLIELLENRRVVKPIIRKLPIMVGGERSVSAKEPVRSINQLLDEAEQDPRVISTSFHVGFIRHDDDKLGGAVVVIPNTTKDIAYCEEIADRISAYTWEHRHEFKFSGNFDEVDASVAQAIAYEGKTCVITDSGDNCGAGGGGQNTIVLREFLKQDTKGKKVLFAGIHDKKTHTLMKKHQIHDHVSIDLGVHEDEGSLPVHIEGELIQIGEGMNGDDSESVIGPTYTVRIDGTMIDVIIVNRNLQYGYMQQFEKAGHDFHEYDIVIVKMGYLDTYLIPETAYHIMALSDGPTIQRSEKIPFKLIARPMWPMDEFEDLYYIDR